MSTMAAEPLRGAAVWHGRDLARSTDWIRPISAAAVAELDAALASVKARDLAGRPAQGAGGCGTRPPRFIREPP